MNLLEEMELTRKISDLRLRVGLLEVQLKERQLQEAISLIPGKTVSQEDMKPLSQDKFTEALNRLINTRTGAQ